jgi:GPH family glycoside/pentoside/hexuronide:cation symporter
METKTVPFRHIFGYALGDGAFSLTMNTIWGFAMFFYTQSLGISSELTGWILAVPMVWDAVTDPVMGYISDNTRSRFGRRHPHVLIGGALMGLFYFFLWYVPDMFQSSQSMMVFYLITVGLISRTLMTWYCVPYVALGFEICTDYNERNKLQSARFITNMVFNLVFCGIIVWRVFLVDAEGNRDTTIQANYARMGFWFGLSILVLVLICVFSTRKYATDTRSDSARLGHGLQGFYKDMADIFKDKNSTFVFLFFCVINCSFVFVSSFQMYVYVSFVDLSPFEASVVHSSGMIAFALGSLLSVALANTFDKKPAIYIGAAVNIGANVCLGLFFLTGLLTPHMIPFWKTSVASVVFWIFQASYWLGSGIMVPIGYSMVADVSSINHLKTGQIKDGSYSAVLSFLTKITGSVALIAVGKILTSTGFVEGKDFQTPDVAFRLTQMMVFLGILFTVLSILFLFKYPVNRQFMESIKARLGTKSADKAVGQ